MVLYKRVVKEEMSIPFPNLLPYTAPIHYIHYDLATSSTPPPAHPATIPILALQCMSPYISIYNVNATATDSKQLASMNNTCWPTDTCPPPVLYYQLRRGGYVKLSLQCTLEDPVTAAPEINPDLVDTGSPTPHATDIDQSDPCPSYGVSWRRR